MSLALSRAIHQALIQGLPLGDPGILTPYGGCWVPHMEILDLPAGWVLSRGDTYDCHALPHGTATRQWPVYLSTTTAGAGDWGAIWCTDGYTVSWFRIQYQQ